MTPRDLVSVWRQRAEMLRQYGAEQAARTAETLADELESTLRSQDDECLTLDEAAEASGFSRDHLSRLIREGKIPNAGKPHAPRICRADLPRKTGRTLLVAGRYGDLADARGRIVRAVVHAERGA